MGRTTVPAVLGRCHDKVQEKKDLKHFLQDHFWVTKTYYFIFLWGFSISLIDKLLSWYVQQNFIHSLEFMSAEAICMTVFSLFY